LNMVQLMPLQPQPLPHLIQTGLPFWYRLTQVVLENRPLNGCSSSSSSSWKLNTTPGLSRRLGKPAFSCRPNRPTVFAAGGLTEYRVLVGVVAAVVVAVAELAPRHADVGRRAPVSTWRTGGHRAVQLVTRQTVSTVVALITHLAHTHARTHTAGDGPARCTPVSTWQSSSSFDSSSQQSSR